MSALSLFSPSPDDDAGPLTIAAAFRKHRLPQMQGRSPDTIAEYETHLRRWSECWTAIASGWRPTGSSGVLRRIIHPALSDIGRPELLVFRTWLLERGDLSNRTINKHLGSLQAIGDACVEDGVINAFPHLSPLEATTAARKLHLSYEEADALKRACSIATWPAESELGRPPGLYWETLVVGFCIYGFRTQEQVRYENRSRPLEWTDIRSQTETPHPDGKATNPRGWLVYVPQKQKRLKAQPLVLPIVEAFWTHLEAIRPPDRKGLVFPFPANHVRFYEQWGKILEAAGIKPKPGLDGTQPKYAIQHMRKTATRWINDHGATIGSPGIGDQITGHAEDRSPDGEKQSRVTREHYDFPEERVLRALTTLPLPASFAEPLTARRPRQRLLF